MDLIDKIAHRIATAIKLLDSQNAVINQIMVIILNNIFFFLLIVYYGKM